MPGLHRSLRQWAEGMNFSSTDLYELYEDLKVVD